MVSQKKLSFYEIIFHFSMIHLRSLRGSLLKYGLSGIHDQKRRGGQLLEVKIVSNNEQQDIQAIKDIRRKVFIEEQNVPEEIELDGKDPLATQFLAMKGNQALGTCRMRFIDDKTVKMERVAVLATARGMGVGRKLIEALEKEAKRQGAKKIILEAQTHAIPFYEKLGYQKVGDLFWEFGIQHIDMCKKI